MDDERLRLWVDSLKAHGFGSTARTMLDALGALGPLAAQALYAGQPLLRLFSDSVPFDDLAETIEQPDGLARLRQWLDED